MSKEGTFSLYRSVPKKSVSQVNQSNPSNMEPRICKLNNLWFIRIKPIKRFNTKMWVQLGRAGPELIGLKN